MTLIMPKFIPFNITDSYRGRNLFKTDGEYAEIETVCILILFAIKINVCYQLSEHFGSSLFSSFTSGNCCDSRGKKQAKLFAYQIERKMLETELLCCLPDMQEQKKLQSELISNNFFYLENGKSIFNALVYLDRRKKSLEIFFPPREILKFKVCIGRSGERKKFDFW